MKKVRPQHYTRLSKSIISSIIILSIISTLIILLKHNVPIYTPTHKLKKEYTKNHLYNLPDTLININNATIYELQRIGLSKKQASTVYKYTLKGGYFNTKKDLLKIYCINNNDYNRVQKYYFIVPRNKFQKTDIQKSSIHLNHKKRIEIIQFNLNTCDTNQLQKIPGIGSFRSNAIIIQRNKLGGYYNFDQIEELYSFNKEIISALKKYSYIDTNNIIKLNINTVTFKQLQSHPYCGYYIAKNIFAYKKIQDSIQNIEELLENKIVKPDKFERLKKYIKTF